MPSLAEVLNGIWYGKSPLRFALMPVSAAYVALARLRRTAYRRGWRATVETPVPVIVVGNVSVGGTGKTPFVIWLAEQLKQRGRKVGIVTRGYRGKGTEWPRAVTAQSDPREVGDEPVLLARRTGCPVVAGPDRVACVEALLADARVDVILSDDGLQHYRLARAFEIAVVDGVRGMGNGLCLPAGPLREPVSRLQEVDAIVVNGGDWGHAGRVPRRGRRHEGLPLEGRRAAYARVVPLPSPFTPSPASATRNASSTSCATPSSTSKRIRSRITRRSRSTSSPSTSPAPF